MAVQERVYDTTVHICAYCGKRCFWKGVLDGNVVSYGRSQNGDRTTEVTWFEVHPLCREKFGDLTDDQKLEFLKTGRAFVYQKKVTDTVQPALDTKRMCFHSSVLPGGCSIQGCICRRCAVCDRTVWPKGDYYYTEEQLRGHR